MQWASSQDYAPRQDIGTKGGRDKRFTVRRSGLAVDDEVLIRRCVSRTYSIEVSWALALAKSDTFPVKTEAF